VKKLSNIAVHLTDSVLIDKTHKKQSLQSSKGKYITILSKKEWQKPELLQNISAINYFSTFWQISSTNHKCHL